MPWASRTRKDVRSTRTRPSRARSTGAAPQSTELANDCRAAACSRGPPEDARPEFASYSSFSSYSSEPPRPEWVFPTKPKSKPVPATRSSFPSILQLVLFGVAISMLMGAAFIFAFLLGVLLLR